MKNFTEELISQHKLISQQINLNELRVLLNELDNAVLVSAEGSIVEFGCYVGTTSLFIRRWLDKFDQSRQFHVYDSFAGLPQKSAEDDSPLGESFIHSSLTASQKEFRANFKKANLALPIIHKDWFADLQSADLPDQIAFAFLDGDFYSSILESLRLIWPKLTAEARVVVHDYESDRLPGVKKAVDEWAKCKPFSLKNNHNLAVIRPKPI